MMILIILILFSNIVLYLYFPKPSPPKKTTIYDYILILGCPTSLSGLLTPQQRSRIEKALFYYEAGFAPSIIISGGSVKNQYIEAEMMANEIRNLQPNAVIKVEIQAQNTYQNMKFTHKTYAGESILIVSNQFHLRRSYLLAKKFYQHVDMATTDTKDSWYIYLGEYIRLWICLYWDIRFFIRKN